MLVLVQPTGAAHSIFQGGRMSHSMVRIKAAALAWCKRYVQRGEQPSRRGQHHMVEALEGRRLMTITALNVDMGDYVAPQNDSSGTHGGSMVERVSGFNGSFSFNTDHNGPATQDGGAANVVIRWGDELPGPISRR
jgi:hypothetical protein